jgi:hypothetical protein
MSDKEMMKIDALEIKVGHINTALVGDEKLGIHGLVNMLQDHIDQSKKNSEEMSLLFKDFKRDQVLEYAQQFNHVEEKQAWTDGRVKLLEESEKKQSKFLGYATGVGMFLGFIFSYLWDLIKKAIPA